MRQLLQTRLRTTTICELVANLHLFLPVRVRGCNVLARILYGCVVYQLPSQPDQTYEPKFDVGLDVVLEDLKDHFTRVAILFRSAQIDSPSVRPQDVTRLHLP